jgi:hypothetical protein
MPGDDQEKAISHQAREQSQEMEDNYLKDLFEKEIASGQTRKKNWKIVLLCISCVVVLCMYGFFSGSLPSSHAPGSETTQPPFILPSDTMRPENTPVPDTTHPAPSSLPVAEQPKYTPTPVTQGASTKDVSLAINGDANPGFPYWPSGTITYTFDGAYPCSAGKTGNLARAFKIINDKTDGLVSFIKSPDAQLVIACHDFLATLGARAWTSTWFDDRGFIHDATIDFYTLPPGTSECDSYPSLEIHEILHVLGLQDTSYGSNVMNLGRAGSDWSPCREMDANMVNCLKNIYSNGRKGQTCTGIPHT